MPNLPEPANKVFICNKEDLAIAPAKALVSAGSIMVISFCSLQHEEFAYIRCLDINYCRQAYKKPPFEQACL
jgi:hypothetical protein